MTKSIKEIAFVCYKLLIFFPKAHINYNMIKSRRKN